MGRRDRCNDHDMPDAGKAPPPAKTSRTAKTAKTADDADAAAQWARQVVALVDDLEPDQRELLHAIYFRGLSQRQAAATLGLTNRRAAQRVAVAMQTLAGAVLAAR